MENKRYTELKYEGKTYTQKYEIDEILIDKKMNWFLDCEIENIRLEIQKDTLIINGGIFYNGVFEYGVIRDIEARNIQFLNGVIYNGTFKRIKMEKGIIFNGTFITGDILFADIRGGVFKDVNISTNVNQTIQETQPSQRQPAQTQTIKTQTNQSQNTLVQVDGEITGQEASEIQTQVQENMKTLKNYKDFIKTFENVLDTKPELVVQDLGDTYKLNKSDLEGKMYRFFRENHEIVPGDNQQEIWITYGYEAFGGNNPKDISEAFEYLESLPGVDSVVHRLGYRFEITFDKTVEIY